MKNRLRASIERSKTQMAERIVHNVVLSVVLLFALAALITMIANNEFAQLIFVLVYVSGIISTSFFMHKEKIYNWLIVVALFWPILWVILVRIF